MFGTRTKISLEEFQEIVEKITSEMFLNENYYSSYSLTHLDCYSFSELVALQ